MRLGEIAQYNYLLAGNKFLSRNVNFGMNSGISPEKQQEINDLRVFNHHIYEYKKGIRKLILTTEKVKYFDTIEKRLQKEEIPYVIYPNKNNINVFFGEEACVDVVKNLNPNLSKHTPEEDFILGIMLGYDRVEQCKRYLKKKNGY